MKNKIQTCEISVHRKCGKPIWVEDTPECCQCEKHMNDIKKIKVIFLDDVLEMKPKSEPMLIQKIKKGFVFAGDNGEIVVSEEDLNELIEIYVKIDSEFKKLEGEKNATSK